MVEDLGTGVNKVRTLGERITGLGVKTLEGPESERIEDLGDAGSRSRSRG